MTNKNDFQFSTTKAREGTHTTTGPNPEAKWPELQTTRKIYLVQPEIPRERVIRELSSAVIWALIVVVVLGVLLYCLNPDGWQRGYHDKHWL